MRSLPDVKIPHLCIVSSASHLFVPRQPRYNFPPFSSLVKNTSEQASSLPVIPVVLVTTIPFP